MNKPALVGNSGHIRELPDVASSEHLEPQATLDWVGMAGIRQPLMLRDGDRVAQVQTRVQAYVDLADPLAKGIHMSRLYLILDQHAETRPLSTAGLKLMLLSMLESHRGLSSRAFVQFDFDYVVRRQALVSEFSGWNAYPAMIRGALIDGELNLEISLSVQYSSTCPASAALARQLIQQQFESDFGASGQVDAAAVRDWLGTDQGIVATPHAQRSTAKVLVRLSEGLEDFPLTHVVDAVEGTLKTPVQTAVKREDEQEFARLNGQNLMFIEDSGRKLKGLLDDDARFADFWVRVEHHESLHAHDAVGVFTKGCPGGYLPIP